MWFLCTEFAPASAKKNAETADERALEDEYGAKDYRSQMSLKPDHLSRPLWVVSPIIIVHQCTLYKLS